MPLGRDASQTSPASNTREASHRVTLDLARSENLALMVAQSRASNVIEIADLVAGMYLYGWDRLSRYWESEDQERVEKILRNMCRISPERWNYWIQLYDKNRRAKEELASVPKLLRRFRSAPATQPLPERSPELTKLFKQAEEIAPLRDKSDGRDVPILTSECVLLCVIRTRGTEISRKLASSGMDIAQLEKDALSSRRAPRP